MPIKGLSENRRLIRLGKIHLGIKVKNKNGVEYPKATDYFVCPPEVQDVYGEQPDRLDIIIPVEDDEMWCSQYYRQYSRTRGLVCKGDGETCRRMIDRQTDVIANRDSKEVVWGDDLPCPGRACQYYQAKKCQEVMNLQFLLPRVPGLGIWQIDTGSINSIRNINDNAAMLRAVCERVSWIPLTLTLEPKEVVNPDDGKKKVVRCLNIRHDKGLLEILNARDKPRTLLLIPAPVEDQEPLDEISEDEAIEDETVPPSQPKKGSKEVVAEIQHGPVIDVQTGEIVDLDEAGAAAAETNKQPDSAPKRDPSTIKTIAELLKVCHEDFKMQPRAVYAELNAKSANEIIDLPSECYRIIQAAKQIKSVHIQAKDVTEQFLSRWEIFYNLVLSFWKLSPDDAAIELGYPGQLEMEFAEKPFEAFTKLRAQKEELEGREQLEEPEDIPF